MPQEPNDNWPHIEPETARAYTKRLGNMTLIRTKVNNEFGNLPFYIKKEEIAKSQLFINKWINEFTDNATLWGKEEINKRQKMLAEMAVKTWPLYTIR